MINFFKFLVLPGIFLCLIACRQPESDQKIKSAYDYVNPLIGTGGHGHTFPGATRPNGLVQLSPDTYIKGWDRASGYYYSDSSIMGFSHTHLSGTGPGDLLDILIMPVVGKLQVIPGTRENPDEGYRSRFNHSDEKASPGYYSVELKDYSIMAELTTTCRTGFHRYTFPESAEAHIILDLFHGYSTDSVTETFINIVNDSLITGYRKSIGWERNNPVDQAIYFAARFSKPFYSSGIAVDNIPSEGLVNAVGRNIKGFVNYNTSKGEKILIKVGISAVDIEGAVNNLDIESPGWDFDKILGEAREEWTHHLEKVTIEEAPEDVKEIFYTALYHTLIAPITYSDVDGRYRGFDKKIHKTDGKINYSVLSLWDTFRAANPLYTIFQPDLVSGMINSMLIEYNEHGILPMFPIWGNETNCMIGYHSIPVIADAFLKNIQGIDIENLYPAMKKSTMQNNFGLQYIDGYNYVPFDKDNKSVSKTLEYAFDDWCIAQVAKKTGNEKDHLYFMNRSKAYKNVFDPEFKLMNGKSSDGKFRRPFDPVFSTYGPSDFIEGNSWQYSFFVPHDVPGLIELYGGPDEFVKKLDELFKLETSNVKSKPQDISGLIGEYAHGNEPSHHVAYLYNYAGQPWKSQYWLNKVMTTLYSNKADGLCGNEDCGQMSAWYVFSALGLYPVNPASGNYDLGTPKVNKAVLKTGNQTFIIEAKNFSGSNFYVQKVELNGEILDRLFITHKELTQGGNMTFYMSDEPVIKKSK